MVPLLYRKPSSASPGAGVSDHLPAVVDASRLAPGAAERAQVGNRVLNVIARGIAGRQRYQNRDRPCCLHPKPPLCQESEIPVGSGQPSSAPPPRKANGQMRSHADVRIFTRFNDFVKDFAEISAYTAGERAVPRSGAGRPGRRRRSAHHTPATPNSVNLSPHGYLPVLCCWTRGLLYYSSPPPRPAQETEASDGEEGDGGGLRHTQGKRNAVAVGPAALRGAIQRRADECQVAARVFAVDAVER